MTLGLVGAHRTGKTTLAREFAKKHNGVFLETPTSAVFKELGLDPAGPFDFNTRMFVQEIILSRLDRLYAAAPMGKLVVTDRTPIDMLGYTLAEAIGDRVGDAEQVRLDKYIQRCFEVTNKRFSTVVLVQPGIPIVLAEGKAAPNKAYIEHLNALMLGLIADARLRVPHFYIERYLLSLEDRMGALDRATGKSLNLSIMQMQDHLNFGGRLQ